MTDLRRAISRGGGSGLIRRGVLVQTGTGLVVGAAAIAGHLPGLSAGAVQAAAVAQASRAVTLALSQEPTTLGYGIGSAYVVQVVKFLIGSEPGLTRRNDRNEWEPYLAETTPTLENGGAVFVGDGADQSLQVTFALRRDVTWSDGVRLTAQDVEFAWQLTMNPDYPVPSRTTAQKVASCTTPDEHTVVFRFMSQNEARDAASNGYRGLPAATFAGLATQEGPVLDPGYFKGGDADPYAVAFPRHVLQPLIAQVGVAALPQQEINRTPLSVGPMRVQEWLPGQRIVTQAVPDYFLGAPQLNTVVVRFIADTSALIAQLAAGESDVAMEDALNEFHAPDLDRMERAGRIKAHYITGATWEHIDLNLDNVHLKDVRVRRAIWHAIDRQTIVDRVLNGKTTVIHTWSPAWRWDHNPDVPKYGFDPQRARDLLREAGYAAGRDGVLVKDGQPLSLKYLTTAGNQMRLLSSQVVQANLKDVGINVELQYVPAAELFAAGDNPGQLWGRTFEMAQYAWPNGDDPAGIKNYYHSQSIPRRENRFVGQNFVGFRDERNDALLTAAENTLDRATRQALYHEQQSLMATAAPVVMLFARANTTAARIGLEGFHPTPTGTPPTWDAHRWSVVG